MSDHIRNTYHQNNSDFIRYLYQEGVRKGIHKSENFYSEIIKFVNSKEGQEAFEKFICINPEKLGISTVPPISHIFKRTFTS
jgi:hypothetical protein